MPSTFRDYALLPAENGAPADLAGPWPLWHEDAITSPPGATTWARLAHADIAFRQGRAWGLQPHVEVTSNSLERMLKALGVPEEEAEDILGRVRAAEESDDPPANRMSRLMRAFEESALG
jgi:GMP synthase-like glutamine amidotransferase